MNKLITLVCILISCTTIKAQLTIEKIMQDPKISVGALPSNIVWSEDSKTIYFSWNPQLNKADSLYAATVSDKKPVKVSPEMRRALPSPFGDYNKERTKKVYSKNGDLFLLDIPTQTTRVLTNTVEGESNPSFNMAGDKVIFSRNNNLFSINILTGEWMQITNFQTG